MTTVLQIDASARSGRSGDSRHGSHTRRLTHRFMEAWRTLRPEDAVLYRDIGARPPRPVSGEWIQAAFAPPAAREPWMREVLGESDTLVAELKAADIIVIGAPMYNFGPPAQLKAWIDNIVRVGLTFGFDRAREGEPYWPMLAGQGKTLVILTARGDHGYDAGERIADLELVIPSLAKPLAYLGVTDTRTVAVEYDEFADDRLAASLRDAEASVDALAKRIVAERDVDRARVA
ncbi:MULTISPECIES: FMN-dependent NADH-azoreductase [unclassified Caulobacter]|uniref:FMN-dependent NADH-azoreductase n=1 Tax=unclassified Caulobacter TaxID=2648921 RepID=UPI0006FF8B00|nr:MULTISPECIES: NAD(P)H-dependent oxidoreductase [unclassified Caulobacter]KQV62883.1 NAD(P)H dehydrogenase [Caulobacter sp. Root342]KQV65699.1 NAD(P)H dehydrogenase [Caulobacter sp. Root343]